MSINFHRATRVRSLIATGALGLAVAFGVGGVILVLGQPAQAHAADAEAAPPPPQISSLRALEQLDNLVKGNNAAIAAAVAPSLRPKLPVEEIGRAWADYQRQYGAYRAHGMPVAVPQGEVTVVNVPLIMARQPGRFQMTFNQAGQIAGFYLLRP